MNYGDETVVAVDRLDVGHVDRRQLITDVPCSHQRSPPSVETSSSSQTAWCWCESELGFKMKIPAKMQLRTLAMIAMLSALAGCGGQAPVSYPASAAPATAVIVDTDFADTKLSVQDGDQVIAMMQGRHYAKVSIRPGVHNFSAGAGARSQGGGTIGVDAQPGANDLSAGRWRHL
jgi:predicted small lipoprotein YifL